jgi:hypothetical protein
MGETRTLAAKAEVEASAVTPSATAAAVARVVLNVVMAVSCGFEYRLAADTRW